MKNISRRNISGFTLIELLIVVLIIGILSAVAVPMYQGAVDKSNFSTMLAPTRSLKEAQEGVRMATGRYTTNAEDLDVSLSQEALTYQLRTRENGDEYNVIIATNEKLPNVRLARYLDENLLLEGQLHCEAEPTDDRANRLCGALLIGQKLNITSEGYMSYLLDENIDKKTCNAFSLVWSSNKTSCYKTAEERCDANNGTYADGVCTHKNKDNTIIEEGDVCKKTSGWGIAQKCNNLTVNEGGVCDASQADTDGCQNSTFNPGSTCISGKGYVTCTGTFDNAKAENCSYNNCSGTFENNSSCEGNDSNTCKGTFSSGSTCIANAEYSCRNAIFEGENTTCIGNGGYYSCSGSFSNGAICVSNTEKSCPYVKIGDGSVCVANTSNSCNKATYSGSGCCCGAYCKTKKCADSVCSRPDVSQHIKDPA